jgi:hypothetical protein
MNALRRLGATLLSLGLFASVGILGALLPKGEPLISVTPAAATCLFLEPPKWTYPEAGSTGVPVNADLLVLGSSSREQVLLDGAELQPVPDMPWPADYGFNYDMGELDPNALHSVVIRAEGEADAGAVPRVQFEFSTGTDRFEGPAVFPTSAELRLVEENVNSIPPLCIEFAHWLKCFDTGPAPGLGYREYVAELDAAMWVLKKGSGGFTGSPGYDCGYALDYDIPPASVQDWTLYAVQADGSVQSMAVTQASAAPLGSLATSLEPAEPSPIPAEGASAPAADSVSPSTPADVPASSQNGVDESGGSGCTLTRRVPRGQLTQLALCLLVFTAAARRVRA